MNIKLGRKALIGLLLVTAGSLATVGIASAKPGKGGGGSSGGGDGCDANDEFPAFVYFAPFPSSGPGQLMAASRDGSCTRLLATVGDRFGASNPAFSFDTDSGTGRAVWLDDRAGTVSNIYQVMFLEFHVSGTDVVVDEGPSVLAETPDSLDAIFGLDLSADGTRAAVTYVSERGTPGVQDNRWSVLLIDVSQATSPCRVATCTISDLQEIAARDAAIEGLDWLDWYNLAWSPTGARLYMRQGVRDAPGGASRNDLLALDEQQGGLWTVSTLFDSLSHPIYTGFRHLSAGTYVDAQSVTKEVIAFDAPSQSVCTDWARSVYVIDYGDCSTTGSCSPVNPPFFGSNASWSQWATLFLDEQYQPPFSTKGRREVCGGTGNIAEVDPFSPGPAMQTRVSGGSADGG